MYENFDEQNLVDNEGAFESLLKQKIELIEFDVEDGNRLRAAMLESNRKLGEEGAFSMDLYNEMLAYVDEYRAQASAVPASAD